MMFHRMNRREFLKKSSALGVGSLLGTSLTPDIVLGTGPIDIAVIKGLDYRENTLRAVELLGGMQRFVPPNSRVAILANPQGNNPGTFTKPAIIQALIQMCKKAGASEIGFIGWLPLIDWKNNGIKAVIDSEGADLIITDMRDESQFKPVTVPRGKSLKAARIIRTLDRYNVLINAPITKEHSGNNLSGTMKNMMGINSPESDQTFHRKNWLLIKDDIQHLDQCIADLNTVVAPDLCVVDATVFLGSNGPYGPGKLIKAQKIIAGTDRVAIDAYCATLLGFRPEDVSVLAKAHAHGLGQIDLNKMNIREIEV